MADVFKLVSLNIKLKCIKQFEKKKNNVYLVQETQSWHNFFYKKLIPQ